MLALKEEVDQQCLLTRALPSAWPAAAVLFPGSETALQSLLYARPRAELVTCNVSLILQTSSLKEGLFFVLLLQLGDQAQRGYVACTGHTGSNC